MLVAVQKTQQESILMNIIIDSLTTDFMAEINIIDKQENSSKCRKTKKYVSEYLHSHWI